MYELTTQLTAGPPMATSGEHDYFQGNYRNCLRPGMGVETIYELLGSVDRGGRWIDLGAGPFSVLWGLGLPTVDQLAAVDISPLSLWLNNRHWSDLLDSSYVSSLVDAGLIADAARANLRAVPRRYLVADLFKNDRWTPARHDVLHDAGVVTAVGLLGLARDDRELAIALEGVRRVLRSDGWFVGASWLRHDAPTPAFAHEWPDTLGQIAERVGLVLRQSRQVHLTGDRDFATMLGWTMCVAPNSRQG